MTSSAQRAPAVPTRFERGPLLISSLARRLASSNEGFDMVLGGGAGEGTGDRNKKTLKIR